MRKLGVLEMKKIDKWSGYYLKKYRLLTKILDGNSDWQNKCTEERNLEAREALIKFYNEYKKCNADSIYCANMEEGHFSYLKFIVPVREALINGLYQRACNEIYSLLHYEYFLQCRILDNLLYLLSKYLLPECEESMEIVSKVKSFIAKIEAKRSFKAALYYIKTLLHYEPTKESKILLLDYVLEVIKRDLQAEFQAAIIYEGYKIREINIPFPSFYHDERGELQDIFMQNKYKDVDLYKDCVFALPWQLDRVASNIKMLFEIDFEFIEGSHSSFYYYPVDLCYIRNGNHSISSGMFFKKGVIKSEVCDITPLFSHLRTDGANWYNVHTNETKDSLFDFRVGLIFEVAKMMYELKNGHV